MISLFIDRERELEILGREWERVPSFVVVYGRRRVGKTRLLVEFSRGRKVFFHTFTEGTKENQIKGIREELAEFYGDDIFLSFNDWYPLFKYLSSRVEEKTLVVLDEFTYAVKSDRGILSALQRAWDHELSKKPIMLVLSGSLMGMMVDDVLSYSSPLYGRRTAGFMLRPLNLFNSVRFFDDFRNGLESYMLVGGVPAYLSIAARYSDVHRLVENEFLSPDGFFYDEPYIILSQELRELKFYFSILAAIAEGRERPGEIATYVGVEGRRIYPYLETLIRLGFVERQLPVARKEKRGRYRIKDPMLLTWFSLVHSNRTEIELGILSREDVEERLQKVFSRRFEEVSKEFLIELNHVGGLPFRFTKIGRWWHKGEEIDLVALNEREKNALFVEVKWKDLSEREAREILKDVKRKAELVGLGHWDKSYGIVAKNIEGKETLRAEGWLVWDLEDFELISRTRPD
ncbi:putative ATPase (AAA+ superfamily) 11 [Thermococcus cleftensis]|uniref:ATPase (AAA+ superfamily) 11 n=1 Tax=Thermococcus cleftensis (strain DSM 27260 / KACC 17922 / CL1) TaxID=163003 RepID=I3ZWM0_THECF|nr:ATP-binding protein [Thermococcus cleftensis]AFL96104.1 putative ATPase (AAA+ superfamily) 11 [Thermococcus cleftensis]